MARRHTLPLLLLAFALGCASAHAADKKKVKASPLLGTWSAAATVDSSGNETPFPNKPGDNPRVQMTLTFKADQTFEMLAESSFKPEPGKTLPKELDEQMNKVARTRGKWSLEGMKRSIEPTHPTVAPKTTTDVMFKGKSFFMTVPSVGFIRFERTR